MKDVNEVQQMIVGYMNEWLEDQDSSSKEAWEEVKNAVLDSVEDV